jgi:hypothetical protein
MFTSINPEHDSNQPYDLQSSTSTALEGMRKLPSLTNTLIHQLPLNYLQIRKFI